MTRTMWTNTPSAVCVFPAASSSQSRPADPTVVRLEADTFLCPPPGRCERGGGAAAALISEEGAAGGAEERTVRIVTQQTDGAVCTCVYSCIR